MQSIMYLPMSSSALSSTANYVATRRIDASLLLCCSAETYVRDLPYWWSDWDGKLASQSFVPMGIVLAVMAAGVSSLWRRQGFLGLVPIFAGLSYFVVLALLGRSGGRWILEVDWISAMVFSIGVVEIYSGLARWLGSKPSHIFPKRSVDVAQQVIPTERAGRYFLIGMVILLVGVALPLMEQIIPPRYTQAGIDERIEDLLGGNGVLSDLDAARFQALLDEGQSIWYGRALYPRYFQSGDGMEGLGGVYKQSYSRLEFFLVGTKNQLAALPFAEGEIEYPHAADVLLIGSESPYYLNAAVLVIYPSGDAAPARILWSDTLLAGTQDIQE